MYLDVQNREIQDKMLHSKTTSMSLHITVTTDKKHFAKHIWKLKKKKKNMKNVPLYAGHAHDVLQSMGALLLAYQTHLDFFWKTKYQIVLLTAIWSQWVTDDRND